MKLDYLWKSSLNVRVNGRVKRYEMMWKDMKWVFQEKVVKWSFSIFWVQGAPWFGVWNAFVKWDHKKWMCRFFMTIHIFSQTSYCEKIWISMWKDMKWVLKSRIYFIFQPNRILFQRLSPFSCIVAFGLDHGCIWRSQSLRLRYSSRPRHSSTKFP